MVSGGIIKYNVSIVNTLKRFSARRKVEIVLRLLCGEDLELLSRELGLTAARVTEMGRWLRRTKLNELPQFIKIPKGNMTLIGLRPEALNLAEVYPESDRKIFKVKPGLISPNQILGRKEEQRYSLGINAKQHYFERILPDKAARKLDLSSKTFWGGLKLLCKAAWATLADNICRRHPMDNLSQQFIVGLDTCLLSFLWLISSGSRDPLAPRKASFFNSCEFKPMKSQFGFWGT